MPEFEENSLEYASREKIEARQFRRLQALLSFLKNESVNRFYQEKLKTVNPAEINSREALAQVPFTYKSELVAEQTTNPPFGSIFSYPISNYVKLHQTSGTTGRPLKVLDTREDWEWWARCWEQVYRAAGVGADDRVFLAFSFGPFVGFWAAHEGAYRIGALTIPGGGMDTAQRLAAIIENEATVLCCTPSYALHMAEVAAQNGIDLAASSVRVTIHAGEPGASIPAVRRRIEQSWGARCYDHAGGTEIGAWGFSCKEQRGLHLNEAEFIAEVLDRETGQPVEPGQPGELVITNLGRRGFPLIRYRTGDVVEIAAEPCACGRSYTLFEDGVIGRADDMVVVRGINVYPSSVDAIVREVVDSREYRMVFYREGDLDQLAVEVELEASEEEKLEQLKSLFRQRMALNVPVSAVTPGQLPRFQLKARRVVDNRPRLNR
ncbi:MAG TPA: AMP-binding protein [Chloroflexia bacterium]|nr:AMP-binding protein [Chloroflexia bacterium]